MLIYVHKNGNIQYFAQHFKVYTIRKSNISVVDIILQGLLIDNNCFIPTPRILLEPNENIVTVMVDVTAIVELSMEYVLIGEWILQKMFNLVKQMYIYNTLGDTLNKCQYSLSLRPHSPFLFTPRQPDTSNPPQNPPLNN